MTRSDHREWEYQDYLDAQELLKEDKEENVIYLVMYGHGPDECDPVAFTTILDAETYAELHKNTAYNAWATVDKLVVQQGV